MAAVLGLLVVVRVEVEVVENDGVGGRQVDAEAAGFGRQDEDEDAVVVVELVDQNLPETNNIFRETVKPSPAKSPTAGSSAVCKVEKGDGEGVSWSLFLRPTLKCTTHTPYTSTKVGGSG